MTQFSLIKQNEILPQILKLAQIFLIISGTSSLCRNKGENSKKLGFQFKSVRDKGIVKLCGVIDQNFERDELLDFGVD